MCEPFLFFYLFFFFLHFSFFSFLFPFPFYFTLCCPFLLFLFSFSLPFIFSFFFTFPSHFSCSPSRLLPQPRQEKLKELGTTTMFLFDLPPKVFATTSSVGRGSRPRKDLPRSVEPFYDAASPAQAYVKLCESICHFPSALYHAWSDLEGLFPWWCVLALKIFHPPTLMVGYVFALLTFDGWIFCYTPGWFWVFFSFLWDSVNETFLWFYIFAGMFSDFCCSAHRMKAYGRFPVFQLIFCLAPTWIPVLFCKKTRSEQILIGTSSALQEIIEVFGSWKVLKSPETL